jgi:elongation factor Ts
MASTVSMESVKILREKSGAGMMDCKKALTESDGDVEGAVDWLRKKGLAAVAKKSGRATSSGLVGVTSSADGKAAAVVEINCETDFVARNDNFQASIIKVGEIAAGLDGVDRDSLLAAEYGGESATVTDEMTRLVATIGENMNLRRAARISVNNGVVTTYMHSATKPGLGKIGVAVALESTSTNAEQLAELGKKLSLHIAAQAPEALNRDQVDATKLQR